MTRRRLRALAGVPVVLAMLASALDARQVSPGAPPSPGAPAGEVVHGWSVALGAGKDAPRVHSDRAALLLAPGETFHPRSAPNAPLQFDGVVPITEAGTYRFGCELEGGAARLAVFGSALDAPVDLPIDPRTARTLTPPLTLKPGDVFVRISFTRNPGATARLRTLWERTGRPGSAFVLEPMPRSAVRVPPYARAAAADAIAARHGRTLLSELGCAACHALPASGAAAIRTPPAPRLDDLGARMHPAYLRAWIAHPQALRPGSPMPSILAETEADRAVADDLAAYLLSFGTPPDDPRTPAPAMPEDGRRTFERVGCVQCHASPTPDSAMFTPPAPWGDVRGKWHAPALAAFLADPLRYRPSGRMPSLALNDAESTAIAAYLDSAWNSAPAPAWTPAPGSVERGRTAFATRSCIACHDRPGERRDIPPPPPARELTPLKVGRGCLDPADRRTPRYTLAPNERADLAAAILELRSCGPAPAPIDEAHRTIDALRCVACHEVAPGQGPAPGALAFFTTLVPVDLGDEGRVPPRLEGAGEKLRPDWLRRVLLEHGRARPYMATRMPQFGAEAVGRLASQLAAIDGAPGAMIEPAAAPGSAEAGHRLVGATGLNCIECHVSGDRPPAGSPGPDITRFHERLRPDWWARYIRDPQRSKPGTRMPSFYMTGRGSISDVAGGEPGAQADAMWAYFALGPAAPVPEGIANAGATALVPGARPMIVRAFLDDAGPHAIAVGFPPTLGGIHFAYDAHALRLVNAWKGPFLDGSGLWVGRAGQPLKGRGPTIWTAPPGPAVCVGPPPRTWPAQQPDGARFLGYDLDANGAPSFRTLVPVPGHEPARLAERVQGSRRATIIRQFELAGVPGSAAIWINAGPGATLLPDPVGAHAIDGPPPVPGLLGLMPEPGSDVIQFLIEVTP